MPNNFYDPYLLIAPAVLRTAETPAESKALIKHYSTRLVVTQCYSVVKNRPALRRPTWVERQLSAASYQLPELYWQLITDY
jgi:hypothetical protein